RATDLLAVVLVQHGRDLHVDGVVDETHDACRRHGAGAEIVAEVRSLSDSIGDVEIASQLLQLGRARSSPAQRLESSDSAQLLQEVYSGDFAVGEVQCEVPVKSTGNVFAVRHRVELRLHIRGQQSVQRVSHVGDRGDQLVGVHL